MSASFHPSSSFKTFHSTKKKHAKADNILGVLLSSFLSSSINCVPPHLPTSFTFRSGTVFYVTHLRFFFQYVNQKNDPVQKVSVKYILQTQIKIIFAEKPIKKICIFTRQKQLYGQNNCPFSCWNMFFCKLLRIYW